MRTGGLKAIIFTIVSVFLAGGIFLSECPTAYAADTKDNDSNVENWSDMKLWYRQPANLWTEALPV